MTPSLDIHRANDAERIELYRNVHDVWGGGLRMDAHLKRRLSSPQHNRAQWYVGCIDGHVVTSLGCYPLRFSFRGVTVQGMAIGAVHTRADYRGRGYAPKLFEYVEADVRESGVAISLLYSDIDPEYYARLGYVECPSHEADFDPTSPDWDATATEGSPREPVSVRNARPLMESRYARFHRDRAICIHRDADYWNFLETKGVADTVRSLGDSDSAAGYLRTKGHAGSLTVRDYALPDDSDSSLRRLFAAIVQVARQQSASEVNGWLPRRLHAMFPTAIARRSEEITMLKALTPDVDIDGAVRAAADFFHEIDHV